MIHSLISQVASLNLDWRDLVDILLMTVLIYQLGLLLKGRVNKDPLKELTATLVNPG